MYSDPLAYLITFTVYGSWLHGDERGSYDFGGVYRTPNERLKRFEAQNLRNPSRTFNSRERQVVDAAIRSLCSERGWTIRALNVRSNHVHAVVEIFSTPPKRAAAQMKAKATLRLRRDENWPQDAKIWSEGERSKPLFRPNEIDAAIRYVENQ